ncbi:MAG: hypothetical protein AAGA93_17310 [Actinomycetota bacterium]
MSSGGEAGAAEAGREGAALRSAVEAMLAAAWRDPGFCVPNQDVYPHQWLWDSCFHAVVWGELGSGRGVVELGNVLARQADDGFVPHMVYWRAPELHADFWGRPGASVITQPPMYGHALAEQRRLGFDVPAESIERARAGLLHLGDRQPTPSGLIPILHPWESGCDDSPRWDDHLPSDGERRRQRKGELVAALARAAAGHGVANPAFAVGSVGFNALVAWNARELVDVFDQPDDALARLADRLATAVTARWHEDRWIDDPGTGAPGRQAGPEAVPTVDSLAALLVDPRHDGFDQLLDPGAFAAPFGPRGVRRAEATYRPDVYWRGSAWPQLTYVLMLAAERAGRPDAAAVVARWLVDGATRSGLAEHWNPETGAGLGARPQTWAGLAVPALRRL